MPFLERAIRAPDRDGWLADGGRLGFILSDRFLNVDYGEKLREHLPRALRVDLLIDFRDTRVFAGALNYPAILIAERHPDGMEGELQAARVFASDADPNEIYAEVLCSVEGSIRMGISLSRGWSYQFIATREGANKLLKLAG